jgi:hypothetical protein
VISPSQRPLPDNTQNSQETDIHDPGRIRTHNPSKRTAADPHLRPHTKKILYRSWLLLRLTANITIHLIYIYIYTHTQILYIYGRRGSWRPLWNCSQITTAWLQCHIKGSCQHSTPEQTNDMAVAYVEFYCFKKKHWCFNFVFCEVSDVSRSHSAIKLHAYASRYIRFVAHGVSQHFSAFNNGCYFVNTLREVITHIHYDIRMNSLV